MQDERIRLIPADLSLAPRVADFYARNREFLRPYEPIRREDFISLACQERALKKEVAEWKAGTGYRFYIVPADSPREIIGTIALSNVVMGAFCSAYLGYKLDEAHQGRGYMTAAVGMVVKYAFEELRLHRIEANVMPRNRASLRVLEKNGFENEGLSRAYLNINGVWEDHVHMVKLSDQALFTDAQENADSHS